MSPEHYPKATVWGIIWCNKCRKVTEHRVDGGRCGPCMVCLEKLNADHDQRQKEEAAAGVSA